MFMYDEEQQDDQEERLRARTFPLSSTQLALDVEIIVAGHICLDITPALSEGVGTLTPGRLVEVGKAGLAAGGQIAHTGLALHKLGVNTGLMGKVGDDLFGQAIFRLLSSYDSKLVESMVVATGEESAYSLVLGPPEGESVVLHSAGCNTTFGAEDVRYEILSKIALFHFGYPSMMARMYEDNGAELAQVFQRVKASGVTTSLDMCVPDPSAPAGQVNWREILTRTLPYVDVFLPGIEDLLFILDRPLFDKLSSKSGKGSMLDKIKPDVISQLSDTLLELGAKIVGIKCGHRGLYLRTANAEVLEGLGRAQPTSLINWSERELWAPCFETQLVSPRGAGDATIAGFLLGLLRGMQPVSTLAAACAVGACSVEAPDASSGIRSWPETLERIAAGWPRLLPKGKSRSPLDMQSFKWRWHETQEVWIGPGDSHYA
ncbi:PfkB family kinase [Ktedonobacter sp. SOSP1-85]|nr:PfkB family kinase [Ktedonobacter sp. SOSP1-85]